MNRSLKILFLFLFVSTVSFVYAQEEVDGERKGGKSLVKDDAKVGAGIEKTDGPGSGDAKKEAPKRMVQHEAKNKSIEKDLGKERKGFFSRLFGKKKKATKEEDPQ